MAYLCIAVRDDLSFGEIAQDSKFVRVLTAKKAGRRRTILIIS